MMKSISFIGFYLYINSFIYFRFFVFWEICFDSLRRQDSSLKYHQKIPYTFLWRLQGKAFQLVKAMVCIFTQCGKTFSWHLTNEGENCIWSVILSFGMAKYVPETIGIKRSRLVLNRDKSHSSNTKEGRTCSRSFYVPHSPACRKIWTCISGDLSCCHGNKGVLSTLQWCTAIVYT